MFKQIVREDSFGANAEDPAAHDSTLPGNLAGPLLRGEPLVLRYGAAIAIVLLAGGLRFALTPILGTQALLLPFVLAVLGTSILAGSGPALLASMLAPILVTPMFTGWPVETIAPAWWAQVVFFLAIGGAVTHVMHSLQHATRVEQAAQIVLQQREWDARQSDAQLRAMAEALPFLIAYIDDDQRYRFANKEHQHWLGIEPRDLLGRHAQSVWGDDYEIIRPHIEAALAGSAVDCEVELAQSSERRKIRMHLTPDFKLDRGVRGFFLTIEGLNNRKSAASV